MLFQRSVPGGYGVPAAEPECPDDAASSDVGEEKKAQEKTTDPVCLDQKLDH